LSDKQIDSLQHLQSAVLQHDPGCKSTVACLLSGEPSSSGPQPSSGGRPARSAGHRQADFVSSTSKAAATADANGGSKRRLVVKPPRQQPDRQEEDSRAASSSEAEISDSDDSNERRPRIKLTIKGRSSHKDQADSAPRDSAADLSRAQKVVKGVLKLKAAAPFSRPVNEEEVPGYGAAVKQPMDLGSVLEKLKNAEYTSLGGECYFACVLQQSVLHWVVLSFDSLNSEELHACCDEYSAASDVLFSDCLCL